MTDKLIPYCKSTIDSSPVAGFAYIEEGLSGKPYSKYANNIMVSASAKPFTLAHELDHMLANKGHFANPSVKPKQYSNGSYSVDHNLMKEGTSTLDDLSSTKRLWPDQADWRKNHRTAK